MAGLKVTPLPTPRLDPQHPPSLPRSLSILSNEPVKEPIRIGTRTMFYYTKSKLHINITVYECYQQSHY